MSINRKEMARRIANAGGYNKGDIEKVLKLQDDIIVEALKNGEEIKQGKLFKIVLQEKKAKNAYDGINARYYPLEARRVPKFHPLSRLDEIELPVNKEE
jgi:nucleoid DNA-binding protein